MKAEKYVLVFAACLLTALQLMAQEQIQFNDLQQKSIKASLNTRYPGTDYNTVTWELNSMGYFDGTFTYNDRDLTATFDQDGTWKHTAEQVQLDNLPEKLLYEIVATYHDGDIRSITKVETSDNETYYDLTFHGREPLRYDGAGNEVAMEEDW